MSFLEGSNLTLEVCDEVRFAEDWAFMLDY